MRVRMLVHVSGTRNGAGEWPPLGGELDVPDAEGAELCRGGMATPVAVEPKTERAVTPPADKRVR